MPTIKLSKSAIDALEAKSNDIVYWEKSLPGFGVKVTPKGRKVFIALYRTGGAGSRLRKYTIGPYGRVTLPMARAQAQKVFAARLDGRDPATEKRQAQTRAVVDRIDTLVEAYITDRVMQLRTRKRIATALRRDVVSAWGTRSIHEIGRKDIIELIAAVKLRGLGAGTNTVKRISAFLMWCVGQGVIAHSPMVGLKLKPPERHRDRTLDDTELKAVILAARDLKNVGGPIIEVLALTGQRREEVAQMMWGEIDENARIWRLPAERSKNEKAHLVHLSEPVWEIIQSMPRKSKYIFATVTGTHFQAFKKAKRKIDEEISIPDWWVHDLRRTVVTGMARLGVAPHIADKILNHQSGTISGIAAVYQKFEFLEERKAALDLWAKHVCSLVGP